MNKLIFTILLMLISKEAFTSDKGIKSEIVEGCFKVFCETEIAKDLKSIVDTKNAIALKDMPSESYHEYLSKMGKQWEEIKVKYRSAIASSGLTQRLVNVKQSYRKVATEEAWAVLVKKCPKKVDQAAREEHILEFLNRLYPEK
jgi:hypothetical protein